MARNFAAELNVRVENFGYDQRAWPVYREALIELQQDSPEAWRSAVGARQILADPEAVKYLRSRQAALARMREASRLPALGYLLSDVTSPADRRLTDCLQPAAVRAQRAAAEIRS